MTDSERYFMGLLRIGRIKIDFTSGRVCSVVNNKTREVGAKNSAGYLHMSAGPTRKERHYILLHRFVWIAANGAVPLGHEINHKNGDKHDNRLSNLEVVTRGENVKHARYSLGKIFGAWVARNPEGHRTTRAQKERIWKIAESGVTNKSEIARQVGVGRTTVTYWLKHRE